jgi:hypothetical protein
MVKMIDAADHLSVQVHPDDSTAAILGAGHRGKTECWVILADGGVLFQGTRPGVNRDAFERALADHTLAARLNRFEGRAGDVFFIEARTVHALGEGCLLYEIGTEWAWMESQGRCTWPSHSRPSISPALISARYGRRGAPIPQAGSSRAR